MKRKELENIINIVNNTKITDEQRERHELNYRVDNGLNILKSNIIQRLNELETD